MSQMELKEELGRGNYGTVKLVIHTPTNVQMAMKVGFSLVHHTTPYADANISYH